MGKRASTNAATATAAKKSKIDPVAFTSVTDAIMDAEQIPERVRAMLAGMLPLSLKAASDERHHVQNMAVAMVEQTLNAKRAALEATVTTEDGALNSLKASESQLGVKVSQAETALANQMDVVQAKKAAFKQAQEDWGASCKDHAEKKQQQETAHAKFEEMQQNKTAIEGAIAEHFKPIESGEGGKKHFKMLEPFLKQIEIEATLLYALPATCAKAADKRGTFDHLTLQALDKAFNVKINALAESIAAEAPAARQRDATLQAAQQHEASKLAAKDHGGKELDASLKEQGDRNAALANAKQAVEDFQPQVEERTAALERAAVALADFQASPLANFQNFKARVAAVPEEVPAPEAPAEEAVAEAPTEQA